MWPVSGAQVSSVLAQGIESEETWVLGAELNCWDPSLKQDPKS